MSDIQLDCRKIGRIFQVHLNYTENRESANRMGDFPKCVLACAQNISIFSCSMDVQATRLNWYRDSSEWKPFHHDAAAMKPDKVSTTNNNLTKLPDLCLYEYKIMYDFLYGSIIQT